MAQKFIQKIWNCNNNLKFTKLKSSETVHCQSLDTFVKDRRWKTIQIQSKIGGGWRDTDCQKLAQNIGRNIHKALLAE